jgi:protein-tyrosine phosphatase
LFKELNFSWIVEYQLAGSGLPQSKKHLEWLINDQKIKCIISLNEKPLSRYIKFFRQIRSDLDFKYHHIPTMDGTGFFIHQFQKMIKIFTKNIKNDHSMLFHCEGGYGRTSTSLTAIWMHINQISLKKAIKELKEIRPQLMHTNLQIKSLEVWEKDLTK